MQTKNLLITTLSLFTLASCTTRTANPRQEVVQQQYVHKYGLTLTEKEWKERGKSGKVISSRKDGVTISESYNSGDLDGSTTYSYPHSTTVEKTEDYQQGKLKKEIVHYLSGSPEEEVDHEDDGSKAVKIWYESGTPQLVESYEQDYLVEGEYFNYDNQLESRVASGSGERFRRDKYGNLISKDQIQNGRMIVRSTFHSNGSPKELTPYVDGVVEGERKTFHPDGEPNQVERWENGTQDGTTTVFQNGEKVAEVPYINGVKHGVERRFRNNGKLLVEEITWSNDHKHGPFITYIGDEARVDWYHKGKQVNKTAFDRLNPRTMYNR